MKKINLLMLITSISLFLILFISASLINASYQKNCESLIKLACNSSDRDTAIEYLDQAYDWLDQNGKTKGNSGLLFNSEDTNLSKFTITILTYLFDLRKLQIDNFPGHNYEQERYVLDKMHTTFMGNTNEVQSPSGIGLYPYSKLFGWGIIFAGCLLIVSTFLSLNNRVK